MKRPLPGGRLRLGATLPPVLPLARGRETDIAHQQNLSLTGGSVHGPLDDAFVTASRRAADATGSRRLADEAQVGH